MIMVGLFLFLSGCGGGQKTGSISGLIIGEKTNEPVAGALVILAKLKEERKGGNLYELMAGPTSTVDEKGAFELKDVPVGTYLLTHALETELKAKPEEWGGVEIENLRMPLAQDRPQFVMGNKGKFWDGDIESQGETQMITQDNALNLNNGSIRSKALGITIMAKEMKLAPVVKVKKNGTVKIEWKVAGR
ncbi:MAG: carboxypeptidase-like regulatory domain-containing protein [Candidatus Aminicenantes bacterium]|nr:carboxypeptidase-like regulatory domain-containing protein [Candidatus Aminicenantes bacterium]